MYTYAPIEPVGEEQPGLLEVRRRLRTRSELSRAAVKSEAVIVAIFALVSLALVALLGGWLVGRPAERLADHARALGEGRLSERLTLRRRDELGDLATAMNQMAQRLEDHRDEAQRQADARLDALRQLRHAERLAAVGQLSAGIAHEVGTPLNVILGHAEMVLDDVEPRSPAAASAEKILTQVERVSKILRGLMKFAGDRESSAERLDLGTVARETCELLEVAARKAGVTLQVESPEACHVHADAGQIQQVLTNLIMNAIHASEPEDRIVVACRASDEGVELSVRDEGCGIPEALVDQIFDPFVTTKGVGDGTGLGLAVSYGIVKEHDGTIAVESVEGEGTTFTVRLPAAEP